MLHIAANSVSGGSYAEVNCHCEWQIYFIPFFNLRERPALLNFSC
jgi:hypothetical protein